MIASGSALPVSVLAMASSTSSLPSPDRGRSHSTTAKEHRGSQHVVQPVLNPPEAFAIVEQGVYRCKLFPTNSFPFVDRLQLKTVIYLSADPLNRTLAAFFQEKKIRQIHLQGDDVPVGEELVKEALEIALDRDKHPVLIMCDTGVHLTGTVVACLRRLQGWLLTSIMDECRNMAGFVKIKYENEQFIELFDVDLVTLPERLPDWFLSFLAVKEEEEKELQNLIKLGVLQDKESFTSDETVPAYKRFYYFTDAPLVSAAVKFSEKKSICDDDDD